MMQSAISFALALRQESSVDPRPSVYAFAIIMCLCYYSRLLYSFAIILGYFANT